MSLETNLEKAGYYMNAYERRCATIRKVEATLGVKFQFKEHFMAGMTSECISTTGENVLIDEYAVYTNSGLIRIRDME